MGKPILGRKNTRAITAMKNKGVSNVNNLVGKAGMGINSAVNQVTVGANQLGSKLAQNTNFPHVRSIVPKTFA